MLWYQKVVWIFFTYFNGTSKIIIINLMFFVKSKKPNIVFMVIVLLRYFLLHTQCTSDKVSQRIMHFFSVSELEY